MRSPAHRLAAFAFAVVTAGAGGCTGDDLDAAPAEAEAEPLRLGRVHVLLEPEAELADDVDDEYVHALEVTARFAFVRGLDEDFARARIPMPVLPIDILDPQTCVASASLTTLDGAATPGPELQELHLIDAGELRLQIGDDPEEALEVPVSLPPDLFPYKTGFEYTYYGTELPSALPEEGSTAVVVEARGSQAEELPPFRAESMVPPALALHVTEADLYELSREALVLRWAAPELEDDAEADELITLRLVGVSGGEPVGDELTCVVSDVGQVRLAFDGLRTLGLSLDADALRVTASRLQAASFDAGDFVGSEMFVERRERMMLALR